MARRTTTPEIRVRPFHCGSQYADWESRNCDNCTKGLKIGRARFRCPLQKAITIAYWDDGTVSEDIADRIGVPKAGDRWGWRCPEFDKSDDRPKQSKPPRTREHKGQLNLTC
jgi:hypothetical protein